MDKNLIIRALTGTVYVLTAIGCTLYGSVTLAIFTAIIAVFCLREYYKLCALPTKGMPVFYFLGLILMLFWTGNEIITDSFNPVAEWLAFALVVLLGLIYYVIQKELKVEHLAQLILGWVYTLLPMFLFFKSAFITGEYAGNSVLMVFVLLWSTDTFAYLVGRKMGKHKLAPSISPGKSVEGLAGGIIGSLIVALVYFYFSEDQDLTFYIGAAVLISVFGVFGDLMESKIKRQAGVKDSGNMLPGHGGFLDRFDSMLLAAPAYYLYCKFYFLSEMGL